MSLQTFEALEQGSDEWLAARCGILTASVIGKLITPSLKVADNDTSRGVMLTLAAERITGDVEYVHPTFDMQRGTDDEPVARELYDEYHAQVTEIGFMKRETERFTLGFSPDGLVDTDGLIEIKSRKPRIHLATILAGKPPAENMAQLMTGLYVSGRLWIDYVSFCPGLPLWVKRIHPDPAWFDAIEQAAEQFEANIADTINRYDLATVGMPATERRADTYAEMEF